MPRKVIVTKSQIWTRRQKNYAKYYELHRTVMQESEKYRTDFLGNLYNIQTELDLFGGLNEDRNRREINKLRHLVDQTIMGDTYVTADLLAPWIWTRDGWQRYVQAFNNLEEPLTDYEMKYKADEIYYEPLAYAVKSTSQVQPPYNYRTS